MPLLPVMPPQPVIEVFPPSSVAVLIHGRNDDPIVSRPPTPLVGRERGADQDQPEQQDTGDHVTHESQ